MHSSGIRSTEKPDTFKRKMLRRAQLHSAYILQHYVISHRNNSIAHILLYAAGNRASIIHLIKYRNAMKNENVVFYMTGWFRDTTAKQSYEELKDILKNEEIIPIHVVKSGVIKWDLLVTASPQKIWWIPAPKLYVGHGDGFKSFDGGKTKYPYEGELFADRILEQRSSVIRAVERDYPIYRGHLVWSGGKDVDSIQEALSRRDRIRERMGIDNKKKVILVWGTFRSNSLFHVMGEKFLNDLEKLDKEKYVVILSIHPHEYRQYDKITKPMGPIIDTYAEKEGFIVRHPNQDYVPYVVASDAMICDCSSGLDGAVIAGIPTVLLENRENVWVESDYMHMLDETMTITPEDNVEEILDSLFGSRYEEMEYVSKKYGKELISESESYSKVVCKTSKELIKSGITEISR